MRIVPALLLTLVLASAPVMAEEQAALLPSVAEVHPAPAAAAPPMVAAPAAGINQTRPAAVATNVAPSSAGSVLQVIFGLVIVLGLLAATLWLLKRVGGNRLAAGSVASIVGGVSVGTRERVLVVQVADQWIVVGVAPGQVTALASMPKQEVTDAGATSPAPNFSAWLKQTIEKRHAE